MSAPQETLLGRVAVAAKLLTMEQLAEATREQGRRHPAPSIGDLFLELGMLTPAQLARALQIQKAVLERAKEKGNPEPAKRAPVTAVAMAPAAAAPAPATARDLAGSPSVPPPAAHERSRAKPASSVAHADGIETLLRTAMERGASDVHVHSGAPIRLRIDGAMEDLTSETIDGARAEQLAREILGPEQRALFEQRGEIDFSFDLSGGGRFRTNVYRQLRGVDVVMRSIPSDPPTLDSLGLPHSLARIVNYHQGMVLLTGPTGCGKSSTMAALVNLVNEERAEHILTIEDPIEVLHPSKRCVVNQRNVGPHTSSFARALRAALREDPDVIVIGELRDPETIALAMTAAETGHLVLATLHTDNAIRTVNRILGAFPPDQQDQVRAMLSESLRAVVSQRLVRRADGRGRVPALEIMVVNRAIGNLIREQKTIQIRSLLQTGQAQGMALLDHSLAQLVAGGTITREEAQRHAEDPRLLGAQAS